MEKQNEIIFLPEKRIMVGMNSRRGVSKAELRTGFEAALLACHLHPESVCALACVKNRYNEMGIRMLAEELGIPIFAVPFEKIEEQALKGSVSDRVVAAACIKNAQFYRFLFHKRIKNGILISIAVIWRKMPLAQFD